MSAGRKKIMDALEGLSDDDCSDDDSSGSGSGSGSGDEGGDDGAGGSGDGGAKKQKGADGVAVPPPAKKKQQQLTLDDLEAQGFTTGPSVLFIKPPEETQRAWDWGDGRAQKAKEPEEETEEERARTREAATVGAEVSAAIAMRGVEHASRLREAARAEREELSDRRRKQQQQETWNRKEQRKRERGQATKGKNFVEEEKRLQRSLGVYSGFDT